MLNIKDSSAKNTAELIKTAIKAATDFGFNELDTELADIKPTRLHAAKKLTHATIKDKAFTPVARKLASRDIAKHDGHILGYSIKSNSESDSLSLHIANTPDPLAEATILAVANTLFKDLGINNTVVHINSCGTNESITRYIKDLRKYLKKISKNIPSQIVSDIAVSPLRAYARLYTLDADLASAGPVSIDYLNDEGRTHLWSTLEYLEELGIPYILDNSVIGGADYFEHTLFELHDADTNNVLAYGGRYTTIGRKAYNKKFHATGMVIDIQRHGNAKITKPRITKPKFYFAQLGNSAKKLGLKVIQKLHDAGISTYHNITLTEMSKQMSHPNSKQVPYVIIMGQKEAIEQTAIVRDTSTHKQKVVPLNRLVNYLKKLQ